MVWHRSPGHFCPSHCADDGLPIGRGPERPTSQHRVHWNTRRRDRSASLFQSVIRTDSGSSSTTFSVEPEAKEKIIVSRTEEMRLSSDIPFQQYEILFQACEKNSNTKGGYAET